MAKKKRAESDETVIDTEATEATGAAGEDLDVEQEDGQVVDLVTGDPVKLTDVEQIRQEEERKLLEEFGYPTDKKTDLIRLDVWVKPKQLKKRKFPLVVLRNGNGAAGAALDSRIYILIDIQKPKTKREDAKGGTDALAEFLRDTPQAEYAVWTNGTDREVYWKETGRIKVRTLKVNDMPRYGKGPEDCFAPGKAALRTAGGLSLRQAFKRCHDHIHANRGGDNVTIFWEFLKVVFAKIQDERNLQKDPSAERQFRIASLEERNDETKAVTVKKRVEALYHEVREQYPELFAAHVDEIDLPAGVVSYVVAQIADYDFLNSSVDVKGEAYEAIVGKNLEGTRGEFFTPRNAVKMGIRMLDPSPGDKCIDPACGTGGFVVVILNYMAAKIRRKMESEGLDPDKKELKEYNHRLRLASSKIFGLDINPNLVKVARMNMVMNNDGQGGITHTDSLARPEDWKFPAGTMQIYQESRRFKQENITEYFRREVQEGLFDIVATNPPFGTKIKIESERVLSQYELARRWAYDEDRKLWSATPTLQSGVAPEILFIERCVRLLKPGTGRMCMVIPDGILGNPDDEYIRVWLLRHCQVLALVDMPVELFLPKTGVQTHLAFFRRKSTDEMNQESLNGTPLDYPIFMAVAKSVGKDRRDNRLFRRDPDGRVLDQFRSVDGQDLHSRWSQSTVLDFFPEVDEHGRMVDDDLPFIADAYHAFLKRVKNGDTVHER
jgi:type I restriction enzyme M protein